MGQYKFRILIICHTYFLEFQLPVFCFKDIANQSLLFVLPRNASRHSEPESDHHLAVQHRLLDERREAESLKNPTGAMIAIMKRIEEREEQRQQMSWQQQLQHLTVRPLKEKNDDLLSTR